MAKRYFLFLLLLPFLLCESARQTLAQGSAPNIQVNVELVQLNVAVMDQRGRYVSSLSPADFVVTEDGIPQKIATFGEGNGPTRSLLAMGSGSTRPPAALPGRNPSAGRKRPPRPGPLPIGARCWGGPAAGFALPTPHCRVNLPIHSELAVILNKSAVRAVCRWIQKEANSWT